MCHGRKERAVVIGTDQRITSGPAATTAASRGRIHGCTRIVSRKVRFFSLAPRAPSIHGTLRRFATVLPRKRSGREARCFGDEGGGRSCWLGPDILLGHGMKERGKLA